MMAIAARDGGTSLALHFFFMKFLLSSVAALIASCSALPAHAILECGSASHYGVGDGFHGRTAANGRTFNAYAMTAAHPWLPLGSRVLVKNRDNGRQVAVTITDRGPYYGGRILDLSYGSFSRIASPSRGTASVCISRV